MVHSYRHTYKFRPRFAYYPYNPYYGLYGPYPVRDPLYTYYDALHYTRPRVPLLPRYRRQQPVVQQQQTGTPTWLLGGAIVAAAVVAVALMRR